eukprot:COSAG06_NODE_26641_length_610_cov_0.954990_1_plen_155_part_00
MFSRDNITPLRIYLPRVPNSGIRLHGRGQGRLTIASSFPYPQPPNTPINVTLTGLKGVGTAGAEFEISLRIPGWLVTPNATLLLNGAPHAPPPRGSFLKIKRVWAEGDQISLHLPMGFRVTEYVGKNQISGRRRAAYEYGPVSRNGKRFVLCAI